MRQRYNKKTIMGIRRLVAVLSAFSILAVIACGDTATQTPTSAGEGTLTGKVTIGPLCAVEPCSTPPEHIYSSRDLIMRSDLTGTIRVHLDTNGNFEARLPTGTYTVDLSDCDFLGCSVSLPKTVSVTLDQVTELTIEIDTGIR